MNPSNKSMNVSICQMIINIETRIRKRIRMTKPAEYEHVFERFDLHIQQLTE